MIVVIVIVVMMIVVRVIMRMKFKTVDVVVALVHVAPGSSPV